MAKPHLHSIQLSLPHFLVPPEMRAARLAAGPVAIQTLGGVSAGDVAFLAHLIRAILGADSIILPALPLRKEDYNAERRQYDADRLLDLLFGKMPDRALRIIGVLDQDMFAAGRTFVFGYAHLRDGVAVYSLARLREEWYGRAASDEHVRGRTYRAVAHELGHTFGNPHCKQTRCVMRAVSQIDSLDELWPAYCSSCMEQVRRGSQLAPLGAEGRFLRGGAYLRRRQLERAAAAYEDASRLAPEEARYHNDMGVALLSLGRRDAARHAFGRAADLEASFPHPYYNLGILCRDQGGAEAAASYFAEGLARDENPLAAHRYLGRLYEELFADPGRARQHYRAYVELGGREEDVLERAQALEAVALDACQPWFDEPAR